MAHSRKQADKILTHYQRIYPLEVDTIKSVSNGLQMYLEDRMAREKPVTDREMEHFFGVILPNAEAVYKRVSSNHVAGYHAPFFRSLEAGDDNTPLLQGHRVPLGGTPGGSGATVTPLRTRASMQYFKRWPKVDEAVAGKKMASEVAAYRLSEVLGLNLVPRTILARMIGTQVGSAQDAVPLEYIQGSQVDDLKTTLAEDGWQDSLSALYVFDYIGSFRDRHSANIFFNMAGKQVKAIDHETGFTYVLPRTAPSFGRFISRGNLPTRYSLGLQQVVQALTYQRLLTALEDVLPEDLIEAVWLRAQIVLADIASKGIF